MAEIQKDFDRVTKKQRTASQSLSKALDGAIDVLQRAKTELEALPEGAEVTDVLARLSAQASTKEEGSAGIVKECQSYQAAVTRLSKNAEKHLRSDLGKVSTEQPLPKKCVNQILGQHFYREGKFDVGDTFFAEAGEPSNTAMKEPFKHMFFLIEQLRKRNVAPSLEWLQANHSAATHNTVHAETLRAVEFKLHRQRFVQLMMEEGHSAALEYARANFGAFGTTHFDEISKLMGCLVYKDRSLARYEEVFSRKQWDILEREVCRYCCSIMGHSLDSALSVLVSAGYEAMPQMLKLASVMASRKEEWTMWKELPVEVELGNEFQFHSVFACPVRISHARVGHAVTRGLDIRSCCYRYQRSQVPCRTRRPCCPVAMCCAAGRLTSLDMGGRALSNAPIAPWKQAPQSAETLC